MATKKVVPAAGGVIWRKRANAKDSAIDVALIHRPKYDDWSIPKGKVDPGETLAETAVREIAEETGLRVRLGLPVGNVDYAVNDGTKHVEYWAARLVGDAPQPFVPNDEVDEVRWLSLGKADRLLSYDRDRDVLEEFRDLRERSLHKTRTLVVLRHAKASPRSSFDGDDALRPLADQGLRESQRLVSMLAAYGVRDVVTSPAERCTRTVEPYAHSINTFLEVDERLAEGTSASQVRRSVEALADRKKPVVACTHRPTLPYLFEAVGMDEVPLKPGEGVVIHHRKGTIRGTEILRIPA